VTEHIREIAVVIEVDTNKQTKKAKLRLDDDETLEAFRERVAEKLADLTEVE
jgi:hypothetical protein